MIYLTLNNLEIIKLKHIIKSLVCILGQTPDKSQMIVNSEGNDDDDNPEEEEEPLSPWTNFTFPINTVGEINQLEQTLRKNKIFRKDFIETFANISYVKNKRLKFDFGFAVIDKMFNREIITKYSWQGTESRSTKLPFQGFTEIVKVIFEILYSKNRKYTKGAVLYFIKTIILQKGLRRYKQHKSTYELDNHIIKLILFS